MSKSAFDIQVKDGGYGRLGRALKNLPLLLVPLFAGLLLAWGVVRFSAVGAAGLAQGPSGDPQLPEASDLEVSTQVSSEGVLPGDLLTVTVRYTNTLGVDVTNVVISDTLYNTYPTLVSGYPPFLDCTYQSTPVIPPDQFACVPVGGENFRLTWEIPFVAANAIGELRFVVHVPPEPEPWEVNSNMAIGNSVRIFSSSQPVSGSNNNAVAMVVGPVLEISKLASPTAVMPGHLITYTLTVVNQPRADSIPATSLVISDTLPDFTLFRSADSGGYFDPQLNAVIWRLPGPLAPGGSLQVRFVVLVVPETDPSQRIENPASAFHVRSAEIKFGPIPGEGGRNVAVDPLIYKIARARRMSGATALAYPTDLVTYTLTVHNPYTLPVAGVLITDTLPGTPSPFTYQGPAYGSPAPAVLGGGRYLAWVVDLPGWGSVTRSFVIRVPEDIYIPDGSSSFTYRNTVYARFPAFTPMEDELAPVRVEVPVIMDKTVEPNHGMVGELVIYTLTLTNRASFPVTNIRLTDTLEGGFTFHHMVSGPQPLPGYQVNPVVWEGLSIAANSSLQLSFAARIDGVWLQRYYNNLSATSPDAYIRPDPDDAPVRVDPPLGLNKTVSLSSLMGDAAPLNFVEDVPQAYIGDILRYVIEVSNLSTVIWTMDYITDTLPLGFYQVGGGNGNPALIPLSPPYDIPPLGSRSVAFDALVSEDINCASLPKTYYNEDGNIVLRMISPIYTEATNASRLAPVTVNPNLLVDLVPYRKVVERGDVFTYTLSLENVSRTPAVNSRVDLTLDPGLSFLQLISGPAPTVSGGHLTWTGLNIPAGAELLIVFTVQVSPTTSFGAKTPTFSASALGVCFDGLGSGDHPLGSGRVVVDDYVVTVSKDALTDPVAPLSLAEYAILVDNHDAYPYVVSVLTDTLPNDFTFYSMTSGPAPVVQGNKLLWRNVTLPASGSTKLKFKVQVGPLYGTYENWVAAYIPDTTILPRKGTPDIRVLPVFDLKKDVGVPLTVQGSIVPYTITLVNTSDIIYNNLRITDTLPAGFQYHHSRTGYPTPILLGPNRARPVWLLSQLRAGGSIQRLVFYVFVSPMVPAGEYYNMVIGSSPSGSIPGPILTAPLIVEDGGYSFIFLPLVMRQ